MDSRSPSRNTCHRRWRHAHRAGELAAQGAPRKLSLYRLGLKSFFEEGRALAQISHASVVSVLNFFRENETVYMVMNYLEGATCRISSSPRATSRQKVFRESTIRSLFDEVLRGMRIVHQHKMLHLDIKPANIFITDDNKAVMIDFGAAREVLSKEGNFIRPMYTPGFAAPRCTGAIPPWGRGPTSMPSAPASMPACRVFRQRGAAAPGKGPAVAGAGQVARVYSDNLIEVVEWCMALDPLSRPQSVFALQRNSRVKASAAIPS